MPPVGASFATGAWSVTAGAGELFGAGLAGRHDTSSALALATSRPSARPNPPNQMPLMVPDPPWPTAVPRRRRWPGSAEERPRTRRRQVGPVRHLGGSPAFSLELGRLAQ